MPPVDIRIWILWGVLEVAWVLAGVGIELYAWANRRSGDTLSEYIWALNIPGFIYFTAAGALVSFIVALTIHFVARGKLGL